MGSIERELVMPRVGEWAKPAAAWFDTATRHQTPEEQRSTRRRRAPEGEEAEMGRRRQRKRSQSVLDERRSQRVRVEGAREFGAVWVRHVRMPGWEVYVGCAGRRAPVCDETSEEWGANGRWGNQHWPHNSGEAERIRVCTAHRDDLLGDAQRLQDVRDNLAGRVLSCLCEPGVRCHADDLAQVANCSQEAFEILLRECSARERE